MGRKSNAAIAEETANKEANAAIAEETCFVLVQKDGEELLIHPDAVNDHARLGWTVAE